MKLTKEMLIDWIDRPPSNSDLDFIDYMMSLQNNKDKAIEEIKYLISNCDIVDYQGEKLMNILKGGSDENV